MRKEYTGYPALPCCEQGIPQNLLENEWNSLNLENKAGNPLKIEGDFISSTGGNPLKREGFISSAGVMGSRLFSLNRCYSSVSMRYKNR